MSGIIATVAFCYYPDNQGDTAEKCCLTKFTLNPPPKSPKDYKMTMCNGCGRESCLCIVMPPADIIPRPPHSIFGMDEVDIKPPHPLARSRTRRLYALKKAPAKKKNVH